VDPVAFMLPSAFVSVPPVVSVVPVPPISVSALPVIPPDAFISAEPFIVEDAVFVVEDPLLAKTKYPPIRMMRIIMIAMTHPVPFPEVLSINIVKLRYVYTLYGSMGEHR